MRTTPRTLADLVPHDASAASTALARPLLIYFQQGIPVGTPYLKGYPPDEELPTIGWIAKFVPVAIRIFLGTVG